MNAPFKPGKLSSKQRDYVNRCNLEGLLRSWDVSVGDWAAVNGLVARGILEERDAHVFYLTNNGQQVAEAIKGLRDGGVSIFHYLARGSADADK